RERLERSRARDMPATKGVFLRGSGSAPLRVPPVRTPRCGRLGAARDLPRSSRLDCARPGAELVPGGLLPFQVPAGVVLAGVFLYLWLVGKHVYWALDEHGLSWRGLSMHGRACPAASMRLLLGTRAIS